MQKSLELYFSLPNHLHKLLTNLVPPEFLNATFDRIRANPKLVNKIQVGEGKSRVSQAILI